MIVTLSKGYRCRLDPSDWECLKHLAWHADEIPNGGVYAATIVEGKKLRMHRVLLGNPELDVDHRNGDTLDNRRLNLRPCTTQQNVWNQKKRIGALRFKGVAKAGSGRFYAQITVSRKRIYLGICETEEAAARTYDAAARKHFGAYARLNFPE